MSNSNLPVVAVNDNSKPSIPNYFLRGVVCASLAGGAFFLYTSVFQDTTSNSDPEWITQAIANFKHEREYGEIPYGAYTQHHATAQELLEQERLLTQLPATFATTDAEAQVNYSRMLAEQALTQSEFNTPN